MTETASKLIGAEREPLLLIEDFACPATVRTVELKCRSNYCEIRRAPVTFVDTFVGRQGTETVGLMLLMILSQIAATTSAVYCPERLDRIRKDMPRVERDL